MMGHGGKLRYLKQVNPDTYVAYLEEGTRLEYLMFTNDDALADLNDKLADSLSKAMGMTSPAADGGSNNAVNRNTDAAVEENTKGGKKIKHSRTTAWKRRIHCGRRRALKGYLRS